jgi:predicted transposase/invertase (TIGR01784 family)
MNKKTLQELTIRSNFMFAAVMTKENNCKKFLEMVLGVPIKYVRVIYEKSTIYNPEYKGIRLDVYSADENNTRYDIEMQVANEELGKRTRYYHSHMDMELLPTGYVYDVLPRAYVIFVCDFDPFGQGKYCYTFENRCLEDTRLGMDDGSRSIFLSTRGTNPQDVSTELLNFLKFVREDSPDKEFFTQDAFVNQLQRTMQEVKKDREVGRRYMKLEEMLWRKEQEGKSLGLQEGERIGIAKGKAEDVIALLEEMAPVEQELRTRILSEKDEATLTAMLKAAAKADSLEQFTEAIKAP